MPKFGDIWKEQSTDDEADIATFMFTHIDNGSPMGICLNDTDPIDKSLIGDIHMPSHDAEWLKQ